VRSKIGKTASPDDLTAWREDKVLRHCLSHSCYIN